MSRAKSTAGAAGRDGIAQIASRNRRLGGRGQRCILIDKCIRVSVIVLRGECGDLISESVLRAPHQSALPNASILPTLQKCNNVTHVKAPGRDLCEKMPQMKGSDGDIKGDLRDSQGTPCRGRSRVRQEDTEDVPA